MTDAKELNWELARLVFDFEIRKWSEDGTPDRCFYFLARKGEPFPMVKPAARCKFAAEAVAQVPDFVGDAEALAGVRACLEHRFGNCDIACDSFDDGRVWEAYAHIGYSLPKRAGYGCGATPGLASARAIIGALTGALTVEPLTGK